MTTPALTGAAVWAVQDGAVPAPTVVNGPCPTVTGPALDFSGSAPTDGSGYYDINGFRGFVFHDQGEHRASGGNHYGGMPFDITSEGYQVCISPVPGYEVTGVSVNQDMFVPGASCYTNENGARVDFGINHNMNGAANGAVNANAVVPVEPAAAAVVGHAVNATGGEFTCPVSNGPSTGSGQAIVHVSVPANVVVDGTRFLCASNENAQTAAAPVGYSLIGSRVDLTTDTGLASFESALTVCLTHTAADVLSAGGDAANLRVGWFDSALAQWQPLAPTPGGENETCALADHFTQFGLMAATPMALPATGSAAPYAWLWIVLGVAALLAGGVVWRRVKRDA